QDNSFAVMAASQALVTGSSNFLSQNQVPNYNWGTVPGYCGYRWGFGWNGCVIQSFLPTSNPLYHVVQGNLAEGIIAASGLKPSQIRVAFQAQNSPAGQFGNTLYNPLFKKLGAKVVYSQSNYPNGTTGVDDTPY